MQPRGECIIHYKQLITFVLILTDVILVNDVYIH